MKNARTVALPFAAVFLVMLGLCTPTVARAQSSFPLDTPTPITTPQQAIERTRAFFLDPIFRIGYSDADMKMLSKDLLTFHIVPLDTNPDYHYYYGPEAIKGNDAKYYWGVQSLAHRNDTFLVNRQTGDVTIGEPISIDYKPKLYSLSAVISIPLPDGPYYTPKSDDPPSPPIVHDERAMREIDEFCVHHYRVQETTDDYLVTVLFNPAIFGSPRDYELTVILSTTSSRGQPTAQNKTIARVAHVQNMENATFIVSKEDAKAYPYITVHTTGRGAGGEAMFPITKPPLDTEQPAWY